MSESFEVWLRDNIAAALREPVQNEEPRDYYYIRALILEEVLKAWERPLWRKQREAIRRAKEYRKEHGDPVDSIIAILKPFAEIIDQEDCDG